MISQESVLLVIYTGDYQTSGNVIYFIELGQSYVRSRVSVTNHLYVYFAGTRTFICLPKNQCYPSFIPETTRHLGMWFTSLELGNHIFAQESVLPAIYN